MKTKFEKVRLTLFKLGKISLCTNYQYYDCMKMYPVNKKWCSIKKVCGAMTNKYGKK